MLKNFLEGFWDFMKILVSKEFSPSGRVNLAVGIVLVIFTIIMSISKVESFPTKIAVILIFIYFFICIAYLFFCDFYFKKYK